MVSLLVTTELAITPAEAQDDTGHWIVGRVIDGATGKGLAGAQVRAAHIRSRVPVAPAISEADGSFRIRVTPGARLSVTARLTGYTDGAYGQLFPDESRQDFHVPHDTSTKTVHLKLWRHSVLTGRVIDDRGDPFSKLRVVALRRRPFGTTFAQVGFDQTDDRGEYRLASLTPGTYLIAILAVRNPADDGLGVTSYAPGALRIDEATVVDLAAGVETLAPDTVLSDRGLRSITGSVSGQLSGRAAPVAELWTTGADGRSLNPLPTATAKTDAGRFRFDRLPAGGYMVRIVDYPPVSPGAARQGNLRFATPSRPGPLPPVPDEPTLWADTSVVVADADVDVEMDLRQTGRFEGRVAFESLAMRPPLEQLQGSLILVAPVDGRPVGDSFAPMGVVSPAGSFRTAGFPPGSYSLVFFENLAAPFAGLYIRSIRIGATTLDWPVVELGMERTSIELILSNAAVQVSGRIRSAGGQLAANAIVYVFPQDRRMWTSVGSAERVLRAVPTDPDGRFHFAGLPPGEYFAAAEVSPAPGRWSEAGSLERLASNAKRVTLTAAPVTLELTAR
jgi:protocatechuate 3,4-dioxygenase beta subunit